MQVRASERGQGQFAVDHRVPHIAVRDRDRTPPERLDVLDVQRRGAQRPLGVGRSLRAPLGDSAGQTGGGAELVDVERHTAVAICIEPLPQGERVRFHQRHVVQIGVIPDRIHRANGPQVALALLQRDHARVEDPANHRLRGRIDPM